MVLHTFHLRLKPETTAAQVDRAFAEIRGFGGQVPGLLESSIGHNFSKRSNGFSLGASMKFTDRAALETYESSALHRALLAWLGPLVEAVQEVDFEA